MNNSSTYSTSKVNVAKLIKSRTRGRLQSVEVFLLFVGTFSSFYIEIIGQLYISEIILILLFPFLLMRRWDMLLKDRLASKILLFGSLWFVSQVFTDLIRSIPINDMLRGWAGILVLLTTFSSLHILTKKSVNRIQYFLSGYALGALAGLNLQPPYYFSEEPWKFGFGYPITLLVLFFISRTSGGSLQKLNRWVLPLLALGGLSLYLNARSLGAAIMLTAFVLWLRNGKFGEAILTRLGLRNILAGGLFLGLIIWGLSNAYGLAAQKGYLGETAQWKYTRQGGGRLGLFLGGRSEILASMIAIGDSPFIGHGSWAKDPAYRVFLYRLIDFGYERSYEELFVYVNQSDLIPAHSHFFQAWIWAGILGGVFWTFILGVITYAFIQSNHVPNSLFIFVIFFSIASVWDIFFSPFGSVMRIRWAIQLTILLTAIYYSSQARLELEKKTKV